MQFESSASPLLTEDKASSLPGQFCPFHPRSALELYKKRKDLLCVLHRENVFYVCPCFRMERGHRVKIYATQLVCDCSNKLALRKSKQPWSQDRIFLTGYLK